MGVAVGPTVGESVDAYVGVALRVAPVSRLLGAVVGRLLRAVVGRLVGASVGLAVGIPVCPMSKQSCERAHSAHLPSL